MKYRLFEINSKTLTNGPNQGKPHLSKPQTNPCKQNELAPTTYIASVSQSILDEPCIKTIYLRLRILDGSRMGGSLREGICSLQTIALVLEAKTNLNATRQDAIVFKRNRRDIGSWYLAAPDIITQPRVTDPAGKL
jgi:hypothetical protein